MKHNYGLIYFQNNVDAASIQGQETVFQDKFWECFFAVFFQFHGLNWALNTSHFLYLVPKQSLIQETRIKDEKTNSFAVNGKTQVAFHIPGFPGRLDWSVMIVCIM